MLMHRTTQDVGHYEVKGNKTRQIKITGDDY